MKLWSQIDATSKQLDTATTELECFEALHKQEQLAAFHRINGLSEEVKKQKDLEETLQRRYGKLMVEQERVKSLVDEYRLQEEIAAEKCAMELSKAASATAEIANTIVPNNAATTETEMTNTIDPTEASPTAAIQCESSPAEVPSQPIDVAQEQTFSSPKADSEANKNIERNPSEFSSQTCDSEGHYDTSSKPENNTEQLQPVDVTVSTAQGSEMETDN